MYKATTSISQLLQLADRLGFEKICNGEIADRRYRDFSARTQMAAMMFAQLNKSNENRPCEVFQKFYFHLLEHYKILRAGNGGREVKNLKPIDATTISLNMNDLACAKFRSPKAGIKIHVRFDYDLDCADFLFITNAVRTRNKDNNIYSVEQVNSVRGKKNELLTNLFAEDSLEVAEIYRKRWTIELFFKMLKLYVYGYFNRIRSSRRLVAECRRNGEVFYLLGKLKPDFWTIADFRKGNAKALKNVFRVKS